MVYFLLLQVTFATASKSEDVNLDTNSTASCPAHPFVDDVNCTTLDANAFCLQPVIVPSGQVASVYFSNRETYCSQLSTAEHQFAQIAEAKGTVVVNFCTSPVRSFSLSAGTHYIGVAPVETPLRISLSYYDTHLGCGAVVNTALIGVPLTFAPTKHKNCGIVLPSRTVLTITHIKRNPGSTKNSHHCVRVRMGKTWTSLNVRWKPVCEVACSDSLQYSLGCGSVVLDASSIAVQKVNFIVREMDDLKFVTAPLMCSTESDDYLLPLMSHAIN